MNPYRELGVHPTASIEEIEARYRLLMREHHPDFHQGEGAEAVAEAERRARNLNGAMDRIRQDRESESSTPTWSWDDAYDDWPPPGDTTDRARAETRRGPWAGDNPFWRPPGDDRSTRVNNDTRARDWEGNAIPTDQPVPCPFCHRPFHRLAEYEAHLVEAHRFRHVQPDDRPPRTSGLISAVGSLRYVPAWLVLLAAIGFGMTFGFLWFVGGLCVLAIVVWTQTSKRFRRR